MCVSGISCFCVLIIKGNFKESTERETQVDLHFYCIFTMEEVDTAFTASDYAMKRLFN